MNAILRRELITLLRTKRAVAIQLGLALLFAILILLRWPTEARVAKESGAEARQVLDVFGYGLLTSIILLVPSFPATSVVREKVQGTLALLLNSPLKPWSIYFGKLLAVMGLVMILLPMTVPAAAACYALGGTSLTQQIGPLYFVLFLAALQLSAVSLLVSSYANSTDSALRITYAIVLVLTVGVLGPYAILQGTEGITTWIASWARCLSPVPAVMEVLGRGISVSQGAGRGLQQLLAVSFFWPS